MFIRRVSCRLGLYGFDPCASKRNTCLQQLCLTHPKSYYRIPPHVAMFVELVLFLLETLHLVEGDGTPRTDIIDRGSLNMPITRNPSGWTSVATLGNIATFPYLNCWDILHCQTQFGFS